jgi:site-specific recombinase XerD
MYSPHKLRHFFASNLLARGAHMRQLTGHSELKVLARCAHANRQDLIDAVNKLT